MRNQVIRAQIHPLPQVHCDHVWVEDGEKCLCGSTAEPYPAVDEWEQPLCCERCGETVFRWVGFELARTG